MRLFRYFIIFLFLFLSLLRLCCSSSSVMLFGVRESEKLSENGPRIEQSPLAQWWL